MAGMLTIGAPGKRTGTTVQTVRYSEEIGLMPEAGRTAGGQRRYSEADLDRLAFIRHARELGFPSTISANCSISPTTPTTPAPTQMPSRAGRSSGSDAGCNG